MSGIWEGIKSFVGGLLVFLAAVIVVALIALLFVSGIGEALALLIVGVAFLVVGFVMSLINRWGTLMERLRSGNYPWYAAFGLGVLTVLASAGDVIGVTPLIEGIVGHDAVSWKPLSAEERWKRGTIGALTILTILLLKRANVKGGEEPPGAGDGLGGGKKGGAPDPVGGRDGAPDPANGKGNGVPDPVVGRDGVPDPANGKPDGKVTLASYGKAKAIK